MFTVWICLTPSPKCCAWPSHMWPQHSVTPAKSPLRGMRPSLSKKAELMFPRSKEKGRSLRSTLSLLVVFSRLRVNLGCLLDPKLSLHVYRKTDASHSQAPCPSRLPQQHHRQGTKTRAAETLLPSFELAIEHYLSCTLLGPPCQGIRRAHSTVCFSCAAGAAAASSPKQGTEAGACKGFGSNGGHGAGMRELGSEPHLPEPEQVGAPITRLPFIFQH